MWVWFLTSNITDNSDMAGSSPRGTKNTHLTTIRFLSRLLGARLASPLHALIYFPCTKPRSQIPCGLTLLTHCTSPPVRQEFHQNLWWVTSPNKSPFFSWLLEPGEQKYFQLQKLMWLCHIKIKHIKERYLWRHLGPFKIKWERGPRSLGDQLFCVGTLPARWW